MQLEPAPGLHSFHLHADREQIIPQVFRAYGLTVMLDTSVHPFLTRFDVDDASFEQAARVLSLDTNTFFVPLDAHRALVAADSAINRNQFLRQGVETVYLTGLSDDELNDVLSVAKNIFLVQQATLSLSERAIALRAPQRTLEAFNATLESLLEGRSQVLLDVRLIQVAHTSDRNTGAQLPQSIAAFNVYAEEQSILNSNASLVQQIISSGLASPNDPLAILGILIASGQVSSPLLSSGFALFGGGLTQSALVPGSTTFNLSLNSSDSRELDQLQLRLEDGEKGEIKLGEKYPIQTSSFSSLSGSIPKIPGLTGAGTSSSLSSLLSSLTSTVPNIPMVQYQDLGLTLTVTPKALRNGDVALNLEMKLNALAGTSIDGNPVLNNREYTGTVTLKEGEATVVATEMDKSQSQAISGTPGLSEIPGLNNVTGIVCTPTSSQLPPNSVDLVFLCDTYHHFEYPQKTMASIHRALRPGGQLILVDYRRIEGKTPDWLWKHLRAGQEAFTKEIEAAGFKVVDQAGFLKENYFVRFEKLDPFPLLR